MTREKIGEVTVDNNRIVDSGDCQQDRMMTSPSSRLSNLTEHSGGVQSKLNCDLSASCHGRDTQSPPNTISQESPILPENPTHRRLQVAMASGDPGGQKQPASSMNTSAS